MIKHFSWNCEKLLNIRDPLVECELCAEYRRKAKLVLNYLKTKPS